jgi:hypothetical protein
MSDKTNPNDVNPDPNDFQQAVQAGVDKLRAELTVKFGEQQMAAEGMKRQAIQDMINSLSDGKPLFERVERTEYHVHPSIVQVMLTYLMVDVPKKPAEIMSAGELQAEAAASMGRMQAMAEALRVGSGLLQDYLDIKPPTTGPPTTGDNEVPLEPKPKPEPQED